MTGICLETLSLRLGGRIVVSGVDLTIPAACWFGVVGANGSGKTTLLRALAGRLAPASGRIVVGGEDLTGDARGRAMRVGLAPVLADLPEHLTGPKLIGLLEDAYAPQTRLDLRSLEAALTLDQFADRPIGALSAGGRQRWAIRAAFAGSPSVVLLDEPFNWLDPAANLDLRAALRELVEGGLTLVSALHEPIILARMCDAGVLLRDGRVALTYDAEALSEGRRDLDGFERRMVEALRA